MPRRVLILGGTTEGRMLAERLAPWRDVDVTYSLSGVTRAPRALPVATRSGGFGGPVGMAEYLTRTKTQCVVDATHPFATRVSTVAAQVCAELNIPLALLTRLPWRPASNDQWHRVSDMHQAAQVVAQLPVATVFLTVGSRELAPFITTKTSAEQRRYLVRTVEPPAIPLPAGRFELILERGPFNESSEVALFKHHAVAALVTKNSGGQASYAKVLAARRLHLPVIMVERASKVPSHYFCDVSDTLDWIGRQLQH